MRNVITIDAVYYGKVISRKEYSGGLQYLEIEINEGTDNYAEFEDLRISRGPRKGKLILKLQSKDYTNEEKRRKKHWKVSAKNWHMSKVFEENGNRGFGDVNGTTDAIFFKVSPDWTYGSLDTIDFCIAKGRKNDIALRQLFISGELDEEINSKLK